MPESILRKIEFLKEVDRLKSVIRRAYVLGGKRFENDAEHSWHVALMAVLFIDSAAAPDIDLLRVVKMLLVHDLVEIDAGDTYAFDAEGHLDKLEREQIAAERIFSLLPDELGNELRSLWEEFDLGETADAAYALSLDRLHPMLLNYFAQGKSWKENGLVPAQVLARLEMLDTTIPDLGMAAREIIKDAENKGYFEP